MFCGRETGTAREGASENTEEKQWGDGHSPSECVAGMGPLSLCGNTVQGSPMVATVVEHCVVW